MLSRLDTLSYHQHKDLTKTEITGRKIQQKSRNAATDRAAGFLTTCVFLQQSIEPELLNNQAWNKQRHINNQQEYHQ